MAKTFFAFALLALLCGNCLGQVTTTTGRQILAITNGANGQVLTYVGTNAVWSAAQTNGGTATNIPSLTVGPGLAVLTNGIPQTNWTISFLSPPLTNAAAFQPASTVLSNITGVPLTNAAAFQPASTLLSNITGIPLTNAAAFQPAATALSNFATLGTNAFQAASQILSNFQLLGTNAFQASSVTLSNFQSLGTNAFQASSQVLSNFVALGTNSFQASSQILSNFVALGTNAFQAANQMLSNFAALGTNAFQASSQTLSNYAGLSTNTFQRSSTLLSNITGIPLTNAAAFQPASTLLSNITGIPLTNAAAFQPASTLLSNITGIPLTNAAAFQPASTLLSNITGIPLTNAAAFQPASTLLSNITGVPLTNAAAFQPASTLLSNITGVPLTNAAAFQPASTLLSNITGIPLTNANAGAVGISNNLTLASNLFTGGAVTAGTGFVGNGADITALQGSAISSGPVGGVITASALPTNNFIASTNGNAATLTNVQTSSLVGTLLQTTLPANVITNGDTSIVGVNSNFSIGGSATVTSNFIAANGNFGNSITGYGQVTNNGVGPVLENFIAIGGNNWSITQTGLTPNVVISGNGDGVGIANGDTLTVPSGLATTPLNASQLTSGTVAQPRLPVTLSNLNLQTMTYTGGTNNWTGDLAFPGAVNAGLVNGNNTAVVTGTNADIYLSGPTAPFTICGLAGGRDGRIVMLRYSGSQTMTLANESSADNLVNRITIPGGANLVFSNSPDNIILKYQGQSNRWELITQTGAGQVGNFSGSFAGAFSGTATLSGTFSGAVGGTNALGVTGIVSAAGGSTPYANLYYSGAPVGFCSYSSYGSGFSSTNLTNEILTLARLAQQMIWSSPMPLWFIIDEGWSRTNADGSVYRDSLGRLALSPILFGDTASNYLAFAHSNHVALLLYSQDEPGGVPFSIGTNIEYDAQTIAGWGFDGMKYDGPVSYQDLLRLETAFRQTASNRPCYFTTDVSGSGHPPYPAPDMAIWSGAFAGTAFCPNNDWSYVNINDAAAALVTNVNTCQANPIFSGKGVWTFPREMVNNLAPGVISFTCEKMTAIIGGFMEATAFAQAVASQTAFATNSELFAIQQAAVGQNVQPLLNVGNSNTFQEWPVNMHDGSMAVALWNCTTNANYTVTLQFTNIGFSPSQTLFLRDAFNQTNLGYFTGSFSCYLTNFDCMLLRAYPLNNPSPVSLSQVPNPLTNDLVGVANALYQPGVTVLQNNSGLWYPNLMIEAWIGTDPWTVIGEWNGSNDLSFRDAETGDVPLQFNRDSSTISFNAWPISGNGGGLTNTFNGTTNVVITINATGVTNTTTKYGTAMLTASSATFTIFDWAGNSLITETSLTGTYDIALGPKASITAASGLSGKLIFP